MESLKILVVDDEPVIRKLVNDFLTDGGFQVLEAGDGLQAMELFHEEKDIALILLDVMMPGLDGWEVCEMVRKSSDLPIVMLTAKAEEEDELRGFKLGVDEYVSKPFSPKILVVRIKSVLKRRHAASTGRQEAGALTIDRQSRTASMGGEPLYLCNKEFELLSYLMENQGIVVSRENILNHIWEYDYFGDSRTVDTHVKKLRQKLGEKKEYIQTVRGMGYKFEVNA